MEKQISIIIPTYNMEAYIGKCLDSLLIPEFDQVEVLVVNDGSKDRSSEIAHSYADRYPSSIRVIDKSNGNYGSCINAALPQATGRYVKVLDADDTFDTEAFSKFVRTLPFCKEDAIITSFIKITEHGNELEINTLSAYKVSLDYSYNLKDIVDSILVGYIPMHRIAYSRETFNRFGYWQSEGISYTDVQWSIVPMSFCKAVRFMELPIYKYLVGRDGQTMDPKQRAKSFDNLFKVAERLIYYCNQNEYECIFAFLINQTINFHKSIYFETLSCKLPGVMSMLRKYDETLSIMSPYIFKAIGQINYDRHSSFKVFNDLRRKNYPDGYKIPFFEAFKLSLKVKIYNIFKS